MARPKEPTRYKNCKHCSKEFACPYRFNIGRWVKRIYCSRKCSSLGQRIREKKNCVMCQKEFETTYKRIICCSNECRYQRNSTIKGSQRYNYLGIKSQENKRIRGSREYRLWRVAVFIRDDYTCVMCSERGGLLEADHIKPFAYFPELRFAIDNGRTLCKECHKTTDTYKTKAMIYKFMNN